jgi:fatty-acyl-CoA synthase
MDSPETIAQLVVERADDDRTGLIFGDQSWTHAEVVAKAATRANWLLANRQPGPFHAAVLLDNVPEYIFWLEAAALVGATVVGANPTHRGDELARDLAHTECQFLITDADYFPLVDGLEIGEALGSISRSNDRVLILDEEKAAQALAPYFDSPRPDPTALGVKAETLGYLLFTSGTSGAPKACLCSQGRLARIGPIVAMMFELNEDDVCYLSMPLFHSNALMAGWVPALAAGAVVVLPKTGRFSASGFLPEVRRFGVTYFNYVGKPLAYILATPEKPDDADNTLIRAFGNEGATADVDRFAERFGLTVTDAYGSTEGGAVVQRTPDTPTGALGRAPEGTVIMDAETGLECPAAVFDDQGRLLNAAEAIGELVSKTGATGFEGYWHNDEAEKSRLREGWYWTGDLAYRDEAGFFYFAGRDHDWLRVDGENFASAPIERILERHSDVVLAAVYAVPDTVVGDQVMAALHLNSAIESFDPAQFSAFLDEQDDLGTKWSPRFLRVTNELPSTATNKVLKRAIRAERWRCSDPVWWRPNKGDALVRLDEASATELDQAVADRPL